MSMKLGLIGHSIQHSRSPSLHHMLGDIYGYDLTYDLIEPPEDTLASFEVTLKQLRDEGYTACNVTFPFKRLAVELVDEPDESVKLVGSTNTLYLADEKIKATNTDFSGFIRAYRHRRGVAAAGDVLLIGAGGVGRAVAFGLTKIGAKRIYVYDLSSSWAESLVTALVDSGADAVVISEIEIAKVTLMVDGVVNCTPLGHKKTPGLPLDPSLLGGQKWAFDAVYVPLDTEFLRASSKAGLELVSGFDLFFYQGIDAFNFFIRGEIDASDARAQFVDAFDVSSDLLQLR